MTRAPRSSLWSRTTRVVELVRATQSLAHDRGAPGARARRLSHLCADVCAIHGIELDVDGAVPEGAALLVANHVSYADPVLVLSLVPGTAIAKHEVSRWPFIGERARRLGTIFVRREDPHSGARALLAARRALTHGVSVLSFPEGTTTEGHDVLPFKRGVFGLARLLDIPIVPIHISYAPTTLHWTGDAPFLPHYLEMTRLGRAQARVAFGDPLPPRRFTSADRLAHRARLAVRALGPLPTMSPLAVDDAIPC